MPATPDPPHAARDYDETAFVPATPEEIAHTLAYALRFDERGKPRKGGWDFMASLAAESLTTHLQRAGFVILRARAGKSHKAG